MSKEATKKSSASKKLKLPTPGEQEKIVTLFAEYSASLGNSGVRNFPITIEELEASYEFFRHEVSPEKKESLLKPIIKALPFIDQLCKNSSDKDGVADIILVVAAAYLPDTNIIRTNKIHKETYATAKNLAASYKNDKGGFYYKLDYCYEPHLMVFLAESVTALNLSTDEFMQTLSTLIGWAFLIQTYRFVENRNSYIERDDSFESEPYDFDQNNLRLLYLHVKLRRYRVSVDLTIPEDSTFEQLHDLLISVFRRLDEHLFRFECDDGTIVVRDEEEFKECYDEDGEYMVLADRGYLGHHLGKGSRMYYLFDYGDCWEHDITVKKVEYVKLKDCRFAILKITGTIPEQYPDYDEDDYDEDFDE